MRSFHDSMIVIEPPRSLPVESVTPVPSARLCRFYRIGNNDDFFRLLHAKDQLDCFRMQMKRVCDDFNIDMGICETESGNAGFPVMDASHGIGKICVMPFAPALKPVLSRLVGISSVGMTHTDDDARNRPSTYKVLCSSRKFRRYSDDLYNFSVSFNELFIMSCFRRQERFSSSAPARAGLRNGPSRCETPRTGAGFRPQVSGFEDLLFEPLSSVFHSIVCDLPSPFSPPRYRPSSRQWTAE